jgi:hypothetical protein
MSCKDNEKIIGIHGKTWRHGGKHDKHDKKDGGSPCGGGECNSYITSFGVICGKPPCSKKGCSFPQPCSGKSRKGKGGCYFNPCSGCPYNYPCAPGCYQIPPPASPAPKVTPQDPVKKAPAAPAPKPPPAAKEQPPVQKPPQQRGELRC